MPAHSPEEIHALIEEAVNAGDLDAFVDLHEEHATTVVPPEGRRVTGRAEIREALAPIFATRPRVRDEFLEKLQSDGLALTHARLHLVVTRDGEQVDIHGRGTLVSRRQDDGGWQIVLANPMSPA
jgi:uncharacterized protein (TIGR02246 family)